MNKKVLIAGIIGVFIVVGCTIVGSALSAEMNYSDDKVEEIAEETEKLNGWIEEGNDKYYYKDDEKQIGWLQDEGKTYYLGIDGKMRTGWIRDNDIWYYMNDDGTRAVNTTIDGCYLDDNGMIAETPKKAPAVVVAEKPQEKPQEKPSDIQYKTYKNDRFGFSIEYPSDITENGQVEKGNGGIFKRNDGKVSLQVYGYNVNRNSIEDYYNETIDDVDGNLVEKSLGKNSFMLKWTDDGYNSYMYFIMGEGSYNAFIIEYPDSETNKYKEIVEHLRSTFKTPGINARH